MNDNQRKLISYNIDKLIYVTDYDTMINSCLKKEILTPVMVNIIDQDGKTELDKKRILYEKLVHRGPTAFAKILEILQENEYKEAYDLLSASTIPSATFSREQADIDKTNFVSISLTKTKAHRSNSYSPSNNGNGNRSDEADSQKIETIIDGNFESKSRKKASKLAPYEGKTAFQFDATLEVKRAANFGSHPKLQVYSMKSKRRGVFFFVNIIKFKGQSEKDRHGAEQDRENLITLFKEMNFTVFYYEDINRAEFLALMNELVVSEYIRGIDSFVCCVQTHGDFQNNATIMEFADGLSLATEQVISLFANSNCPSLTNKPKAFFFPFCRGKISDKLKKITLIQTDGQSSEVPSYSDILICYGTVPGFTTHRDTGFGSWYVREMCKIFAEHACESHIEDMLKMVGAKTMAMTDAGRVQVSSTESRGFNRLMFFNPKISD